MATNNFERCDVTLLSSNGKGRAPLGPPEIDDQEAVQCLTVSPAEACENSSPSSLNKIGPILCMSSRVLPSPLPLIHTITSLSSCCIGF
ncbi:hypothetical protein AB3S75_015180 [Citrus x aurantiifolia]